VVFLILEEVSTFAQFHLSVNDLPHDSMYCTVKNFGGKKNFGEFGETQQFANFFCKFSCFVT